VEGLEKLTFGSALFAAASRSRNIEPMPNIDPARFPHLTAAVRYNPYDEQAMFIETVRAFLRGLPKTAPEDPPAGTRTYVRRSAAATDH
jgi:TetR/AcrR family tetracycline transcriptional repressor